MEQPGGHLETPPLHIHQPPTPLLLAKGKKVSNARGLVKAKVVAKALARVIIGEDSLKERVRPARRLESLTG